MSLDKIVVLDDALCDSWMELIRSMIRGCKFSRVFSESQGRHGIADADELRAADLLTAIWIERTVHMWAIGEGFGRVVLSPYLRSCVSAKVYRPGDFQPEHADTNSVTVMVHVDLGDSCEGGSTVFTDGRKVDFKPGRMVFFYGANRHWAEKVTAGQKTVLCVNLYDIDQPIERPEGTDERIYGR